MERKIKIQAVEEEPTKSKWKFTARDLGISIVIYIDKIVDVAALPEDITITLKKR